MLRKKSFRTTLEKVTELNWTFCGPMWNLLAKLYTNWISFAKPSANSLSEASSKNTMSAGFCPQAARQNVEINGP